MTFALIYFVLLKQTRHCATVKYTLSVFYMTEVSQYNKCNSSEFVSYKFNESVKMTFSKRTENWLCIMCTM